MQTVRPQIWILMVLLILPESIFCDQPAQKNSMRSSDFDRRSSVNNVLSDLRNNWQSPISYLQTRGYIPPRGQTYNVQFKSKCGQKKSRDGGRMDNNKRINSGCDADVDKLNTNYDSGSLKNFNNNPNTNNYDAQLKLNSQRKLNAELNSKLNFNSGIKNNQKTDSYSTADALARLKVNPYSKSGSNSMGSNSMDSHSMDTNSMDSNSMDSNSMGSYNTNPNLINELKPVSNLNAYAMSSDMSSELNQPNLTVPSPSQKSAADPKNANFLHNVKNKFLGFFRSKPDIKGSGRRSYGGGGVFENYDFLEPMAKEYSFGDDKLQDISNLYGKATDPEIERIIQRGLRKDNEYDKEFLSSKANKDILSKLGQFV